VKIIVRREKKEFRDREIQQSQITSTVYYARTEKISFLAQ
jgi:hypothetical protein